MAEQVNITDSLQNAVDYLRCITSRSGSETDYAYGYSPNNIKTLIITPHRAYIIPFLRKAQNGEIKVQPSKYVPYQIYLTYLEEQEKIREGKLKEKYPLNCLGGSGNWSARKAQNIESIIIFTDMDKESSGYPTKAAIEKQMRSDVEFSSKLQGFVPFFKDTFKNYVLKFNGDKSLTETFDRLKYVAVISGVTESRIKLNNHEFFSNSSLDNKDTLTKACSGIGANVSFIYTAPSSNECNKYIGKNIKKYPIDAEIERYLQKFVPKEEEEQKDEKKSSKPKVNTSEYDEMLEKYNKYYKLVYGLRKCIKDDDYSPLAIGKQIQFDDYLIPALHKTEGVLKSQRLAETSKDMDEDTRIQENMQKIKSYEQVAYLRVLESFFSHLDTMASNPLYKLSAKVCANECCRSIPVPPQLESIRNSLIQKLELSNDLFTGKRSVDGFCNLCAYYTELFLNTKGEATTKEYWKDRITDKPKKVADTTTHTERGEA